MGFRVLDMRDMAGAFADSAFDVVLDKGTLDAMLCADDDEGAAGGMLREVRRVLRPGAASVAYLMLSMVGRRRHASGPSTQLAKQGVAVRLAPYRLALGIQIVAAQCPGPSAHL